MDIDLAMCGFFDQWYCSQAPTASTASGFQSGACICRSKGIVCLRGFWTLSNLLVIKHFSRRLFCEWSCALCAWRVSGLGASIDIQVCLLLEASGCGKGTDSR